MLNKVLFRVIQDRGVWDTVPDWAQTGPPQGRALGPSGRRSSGFLGHLGLQSAPICPGAAGPTGGGSGKLPDPVWAVPRPPSQTSRLRTRSLCPVCSGRVWPGLQATLPRVPWTLGRPGGTPGSPKPLTCLFVGLRQASRPSQGPRQALGWPGGSREASHDPGEGQAFALFVLEGQAGPPEPLSTQA